MKVSINNQKIISELAPVIIFTYNRLSHLQQTLDALAKNKNAKYSEIFIFSDGYKNERDRQSVIEVREYLKSFEETQNFKNVTVFFNEKNKGLANNIINGVTEIIRKYSKVIVIEDDVVTSEDFLSFMNDSLNYYKDDETVWSIGGYTHPMQWNFDYDKDVFAIQRCSSYCWGTWENRWNKIDWNITDYNQFKFNFVKRYKFNRPGNDMSAMLDSQMKGLINSWAIRFDYNMWKHGMVNVLPVMSKANNIGHDGSGTHANVDLSDCDKFFSNITSHEYILEKVVLDKMIVAEYRKIFHCSLYSLVKSFIKIYFS